MQSLMLGLVAALLWGLHDFTVRKIGEKADAAALYLVVLGVGVVFLTPFAASADDWHLLTPGLVAFCAVTGLAYAFGVYALFRAYTIGPVRLVAPICGAYPLVSVALAVAQGQPAGAMVWLASLVVLAGIAVVAQGDSTAAHGTRRQAIGWSVAAALGFAISFDMLHSAAQQVADLPVALIARAVGFVGVLIWVTRQHIDIKPAFAIWPVLMMMGALDVGGMVAVTAAAGFARPEFASISSSCFGLVTILLAWRFLREQMTTRQWLGVAAVFSGIVVLGLV